jgi:uncharacterized Zn-binding protein involved in type VI secretion
MLLPASRLTDLHTCPVHGGGPLVGPGASNVTINFLAAIRAADSATCLGPPDFVVTGSENVFIGGPTKGATLGDPVRAAGFFPGQQANKDTCALMTTQGIAHQATGVQNTEAQMQSIGIASGAYQICNGTVNESAVMAQAGIPATTVGSPTIEDLAQALGEGRAVIVGLDARHIWNQANPQPLGHAIRVTGVEFDATGKPIAVIINDTGSGIAAQRVPSADFSKALTDFGGGRMTTSNNPIP